MSDQDNSGEAIVEAIVPVQDKIFDNDKQLVTYANLSIVGANLEEAFLHFGNRVQDPPNMAVGVAKIYISLPSLKRLAKVTSDLVEVIEAARGKEIESDPNATLNSIDAQERVKLAQQLQVERTEKKGTDDRADN